MNVNCGLINEYESDLTQQIIQKLASLYNSAKS